MKIEIWSDVVCPFCYIGKRRFEAALKKFAHQDKIEVSWKSFQLNPDMHYQPGETIYSYMARHKGWTEEYARQATAHVRSMAKEVGLDFDFDRSVPANTLKAHSLLHLAAKHGLQDAAEEALFRAHFMEGKNLEDDSMLLALGAGIGLPQTELKTVLENKAFSAEINSDIEEARQIGVRGVPFFVINRKYAISGAQPEETFTQALEKAWQEQAPAVQDNSGASCSINGDCT